MVFSSSLPKEAVGLKKQMIIHLWKSFVFVWRLKWGQKGRLGIPPSILPSIPPSSYPLIQQIMIEALLCIRTVLGTLLLSAFLPPVVPFFFSPVRPPSFSSVNVDKYRFKKTSLLVRTSLYKIDADGFSSFRMLTAVSTTWHTSVLFCIFERPSSLVVESVAISVNTPL